MTVLAVAFFILPTRVHERYLYPFFALGAILAAFSWRWRVAYVVFAITTFLNMYVVLTTLYAPGNPGIVDWLGIGESIRSEGWVTAIALANLAAALWVFAQLRDGAFVTLRRELAGRLEGWAAAPVEAVMARRRAWVERSRRRPGRRRRARARRGRRGRERCAAGGVGGGHGPVDGLARARRGPRRGAGRRDAHLERAADRSPRSASLGLARA